mgnify:CR=1 FL=1
MRMHDAYRFTIFLGDPDQFFNLFADKIRFEIVINKNVPLGKRDLKQAR